MDAFFNALIPISICVILPIAIMFLSVYPRINNDNKRTQAILKAIETGNCIDADKLAEAFNSRQTKEPGSPRKTLMRRLLCGCIFTFTGIASIAIDVIYSYTRDFPWELGFFFVAFGALFISIGLGFLLVYFVSRRHIKD